MSIERSETKRVREEQGPRRARFQADLRRLTHLRYVSGYGFSRTDARAISTASAADMPDRFWVEYRFSGTSTGFLLLPGFSPSGT